MTKDKEKIEPKKEEIELNIKDRVIMLAVFPTQGNFNDLIIRQDIVDMTKFSEEENEEYKIVYSDNGGVTWDNDTITFKYKFNKSQVAYVQKQLRRLSQKEELTVDHLNLYKLFKCE